MKQEKKTCTGSETNPEGVTEVWITTDIKLSVSYNSVGTSIGMKATVREDETPEQKVKVLARKIEKILKVKSKDMMEFLNIAAKSTGN